MSDVEKWFTVRQICDECNVNQKKFTEFLKDDIKKQYVYKIPTGEYKKESFFYTRIMKEVSRCEYLEYIKQENLSTLKTETTMNNKNKSWNEYIKQNELHYFLGFNECKYGVTNTSKHPKYIYNPKVKDEFIKWLQ